MAMSENMMIESEKLLACSELSSAEDAKTLHKARREYQGYADYFVSFSLAHVAHSNCARVSGSN